MTATIRRVPRARGTLTDAQIRRYERARRKRDEAEDKYKAELLAIHVEGASFAELSKISKHSTETLQRWMRDASS